MHQHHLWRYGIIVARTQIGAIQRSVVVCGGGGIIQSNIGSLNLNHSDNNTAQHHNPQILKIMCVKIENPYAGWTLKTKGRLCVCAVYMNH